jgi:hypothetical protein
VHPVTRTHRIDVAASSKERELHGRGSGLREFANFEKNLL